MRVAVVGYGRMGRIHTESIAHDDRVDEVIVVDHDVSKLGDLPNAQAAVAAETSLDTAIASSLDAAVVATPATTHAAIVTQLLLAEVPTLCEKPLSVDVADARTLGVLASQTPLQVGFQRRFDPAYIRLSAACEERRRTGESATLYRLATGDREPPPPSFVDTAGSIFHDMLIHEFDVLRMLTTAAVVAVTAHWSSGGKDDGAVESTAIAVLELDDGARVVITGSRACGSGYDVSASVTFPSGILSVGLGGPGSAHVHLDGPANTTPRWRGFEDRFDEAYVSEVRTFLDIVSGASKAAPGHADAVAALVLADAAVASATRGCRIALAEDVSRAVTSRVDGT